MQTVKIICVGKLKDKFFYDASDEYLKRLKAYCKTEIIEIPAAKTFENNSAALTEKALDEEGKKIISKINPSENAAALCIEGKNYSSEEFAGLIKDFSAKKNGDIAFIIGGSYGLSDEVKNRADVKISMSKMTFPQRLARIMLLEQIYRAYNINANGKYHK